VKDLNVSIVKHVWPKLNAISGLVGRNQFEGDETSLLFKQGHPPNRGNGRFFFTLEKPTRVSLVNEICELM
jgi:hypothetical protein